MYVAIEGVDCVGKSTQILLLQQVFKDAIFTQEPGATNLGVHLRELLLKKPFKMGARTELLLFLADRAAHFEELLNLHKNDLIISDRSFISGMAYAKGFDKNLLFMFNSFALDNFFPQKVIFLKGSKELLRERLSQKSLDSIEKRGLNYFCAVQDELEKTLNFLQAKISLQILSLQADQSKEKLHQKIKDFIND